MNIGKQNELNILKNLSKRKFQDLPDKWKEHMKQMFPFIEDNDYIYARYHLDSTAKPDIDIRCRHSVIKLSIKTGHNPSIHEEYGQNFFRFLASIGISKRTISIIQFYHFGVSRKLKNYSSPFSKDEIVKNYSAYLKEANSELNKPEIIEKVVYRTCIVGASEAREEIDFFYYGSFEKGFLLSKEDVYRLILKEKKDDAGPIHFGGLIYQPAGRRIDRRDRYYSRIKWPVLCVKFYDSDII